VCEEQRFVTDVVVRARHNLSQWLGYLASARVGHMSQRRLLSETQYVLELDSTNYEAMLALTDQINRKGWPYQVALMGSATSRLVSSHVFEEEAPLLEITNITYASGWWELELVVSEGLVFLTWEVAPLPCIHTRNSCCTTDYMYSPFKVGIQDLPDLGLCKVPVSNKTQIIGTLTTRHVSYMEYRNDSTVLLRLLATELANLTRSDSNTSNFTIGLLSADRAATQVYVSLRRDQAAYGYSVGNFTRQVAPFVMAQVEQVGARLFLRSWTQSVLPNASVAFVQYAYGDMDWLLPSCAPVNASCFHLPPMCQAHATLLPDGSSMLEMWVPLHSNRLDLGNISLYFVLQRNHTLARVMTQAQPTVAIKHCEQLAVSDNIEIQLLQGLQLRQLYRGPVLPFMPLAVEPQTDTLVTVVARSGRGAVMEELRAVHARTAMERDLVEAGQPCPTCVMEQLVLHGRATSPRSCFVFGAGDPAAWIQQYVGLVGSTLALDVLAKVPADVKAGSAAAAWINPVWPYATDEEIRATTYLYAKFGQPKAPGPVLRRLLGIDPIVISSQQSLRAQWLMIAAASVMLFIWHILQTIQWAPVHAEVI